MRWHFKKGALSMTCPPCGPKPGVTECGSGWPYSGFFWDRYPPLRCPDDFYRQEMCDYLSQGFGCGMMPPDFPPRYPPPPQGGSTGDLTTAPQFQPRFFPYQVAPIPNGNARPPSGNVRAPMPPMQVGLRPSDLNAYYRRWMYFRSFKHGMCVPPEIAWRGMVADGPVTTRPPPLNDQDVSDADGALEDAAQGLDDAMASGDQQAIDAAQQDVRNARKALEQALKNGGYTAAEYLAAKAAEAAAAEAGAETDTTGGGGPAEQPPSEDKSIHPAWWLAIAAAAGVTAWAGYKLGSR